MSDERDETIDEQFHRVKQSNPTVRAMREQGLRYEEIIVALDNELHQLKRLVLYLDLYLPKKYVLPDGNKLVFQCPVDRIPETEMVPKQEKGE